MGEIRLSMGTATAYPGGTVVIGGDGSVDDDSDASYVRYAVDPYTPLSENYYWHPAAAASLPDFSAAAGPVLFVRIRSSLEDAIDPDAPRRLAILNATTFSLWFNYAYTPPASPGWSDVTGFPLVESVWDEIQAGNVSVEPVHTSGGAFAANLYEVELIVRWAGGRSRPLRRYPPVNNGGFGPTRHYPRSVNRRVGGSY